MAFKLGTRIPDWNILSGKTGPPFQKSLAPENVPPESAGKIRISFTVDLTFQTDFLGTWVNNALASGKPRVSSRFG